MSSEVVFLERIALCRQTAYVCCSFLLCFLFNSAAIAQNNPHCDPDILASIQNPNHYKARNIETEDQDRCEGIYAQQVGSTILQVVSFTESFEEFNPFSDSQLQMTWSSYKESETKIRSTGIKKNLFYRMDTTRPAARQHFIWPTDILFAQDIQREDLGVAAWSEDKIGGQDIKVYLPLRISRQDATRSVEQYKLLILPGQELKEVYTSLAPVDESGRRGEYIYENEVLLAGPYPASRTIAIDIPLDALTTAGLYYLELSAELRKRGSEERIGVYFFHDGTEGS